MPFPKPNISGTEFGFEVHENPTVMSGYVVRWKERGPINALEISASRDGIMLQGQSHPYAGDAVEIVVKVLAQARAVHESLLLCQGRPGPGWTYSASPLASSEFEPLPENEDAEEIAG